MIEPQLHARISRMMLDYARSIDDDRLEAWPEFFLDRAVYKVVTKQNELRGYPIPLIYCAGKAMMKDRILALRRASVHAIHTDRHVLSGTIVDPASDDGYQIETSFSLFQTDVEGETRLFSTGAYHAVVELAEGALKFRENIVVIDNHAVCNHISNPL